MKIKENQRENKFVIFLSRRKFQVTRGLTFDDTVRRQIKALKIESSDTLKCKMKQKLLFPVIVPLDIALKPNSAVGYCENQGQSLGESQDFAFFCLSVWYNFSTEKLC